MKETSPQASTISILPQTSSNTPRTKRENEHYTHRKKRNTPNKKPQISTTPRLQSIRAHPSDIKASKKKVSITRRNKNKATPSQHLIKIQTKTTHQKQTSKKVCLNTTTPACKPPSGHSKPPPTTTPACKPPSGHSELYQSKIDWAQ